MATVVSSNSITCPVCGATAIVHVWSCGCQTGRGSHMRDCPKGKENPDEIFASYKLEVWCAKRPSEPDEGKH